MKNLLFFL